jgi:3',5'-cyclic AMP phosphodiesterase CpdA
MRILWFTDSHVQKRPPAEDQFCVQPFWRGEARKLFDRLGKLARSADALIVSGDATHTGKQSDVRIFFDLLAGVARNKPVFLVLGNHDLANLHATGIFAREARKYPNIRFGEDLFPLGGLDLVLLNNQYLDGNELPSIQWSPRCFPIPVMPAAQAARLNAMLVSGKNRPALVIAHCPCHVLPGNQIDPSPALIAGMRRYRKTLHGVLDKHRRVRAVLGGHVHYNCTLVGKHGRIHQSLSSLIEYPFHVRVLEIAGGSLCSRLASLAGKNETETAVH